MEKLNDAIAKARAQRTGAVGQLPEYNERRPPEEENGEAVPASPRNASRNRGTRRQPSPAPAHITYTQTRQVELDPKVLEHNRVIAGQHDDRRVEAYRHLRTQVLQTFEQNDWHNLAITSPLEDAGKTLTAVNLAISLSVELDHTVLLVDLDLKKPNVHTTFGVEVEHGLIDVVEGRVPVRDALFNPHVPRLVVLPGRALGHNSSEVLTSPAMRELLRDVTTRYDSRLVIFDLPPLLRNDDALKFIPHADATLMVVEDGVNTPEEVERALHLTRNANLIGTVLNKAR